MPSRMITTSVPSSTRRLARSMASSATVVCSSEGRSKVEATTSPLEIERRMSVTSSGRSSTSSTMRCTPGLFGLDRVGDLLHDRRLARLGRGDDQPALALADRGQEVDDAGGQVVLVAGMLQDELGVREEGREVLEAGAAASRLGVEPGDGVDPQQRRVLLVVGGGPAGPLDEVALAQGEPPRLADRHVDVLGRRQVAVAAHEAVALVAQVEQAAHLDQVTLVGAVLGRAALQLALAPWPTLAAPAPAAPAVARVGSPARVVVVLLLLARVPGALALLRRPRPGGPVVTVVGGAVAGHAVVARPVQDLGVERFRGHRGPRPAVADRPVVVDLIDLVDLVDLVVFDVGVGRRAVGVVYGSVGTPPEGRLVAVRRHAGRFQDLIDDVRLLGPGGRLQGHRLGDRVELVSLLGLEYGPFELLFGSHRPPHFFEPSTW